MKDALYPFGYGLSYTTFEYSNLVVPAKAPGQGDIKVTVDVTNTGTHKGDNVVELYLKDVISSVISGNSVWPERRENSILLFLQRCTGCQISDMISRTKRKTRIIFNAKHQSIILQ